MGAPTKTSKPDGKKPRPSISQLLREAFSPAQLYVLLSAVLVLANARLFYGSLKLQTEHVHLWFQRDAWDGLLGGVLQPSWSAPLDDVFIHFDFARSAAEGAPFQWTPGNGYSSGGTSLLYPFVLAVGLLAGAKGLALMHFAAVVACVSTFAFLLAARRMFGRLSPYWALLAPVFLLSTGALNWTLLSGMEVALFLALFGWVLVTWDELLGALAEARATRGHSLGLGVAGAFLVAGRPEAAPIVGVVGLWAAGVLWRQKRTRGALLCLLLTCAPGALVVLTQMTANYILTGSTSAAGALAKLEMHHPYLTRHEVVEAWLHFMSYQFLRLTHYHFSAIIGPGYVPWVLALLALLFQQTRRYAILLWLCIVFWICLIALNGQVRWQNERYTMPAVAWVLLAAALGVAGTVDWALRRSKRSPLRVLLPAVLALACATFAHFQAPRFREQVWFFGRASRNILEQHVRAGAYLGHGRLPRPSRILLSDAGALPYAAQIPAFDLIGLGGYEGLPLAAASRQGVGAAIELLESLPFTERPDIMALYPNWWPTFVLWFGQMEAEFKVRGNVICGGASKVIYSPRWSPLDDSGVPFSLQQGERVVDEVDIADVRSERHHRVTWDREAQGYVDMKMLPRPDQPRRDLWDAGRLISTQMGLSFVLDKPGQTLLLRVAPATKASILLEGSGQPTLNVLPQDSWQEVRIPLSPEKKGYTLRVVEGELMIFHLFVTQSLLTGPP